MTRKLKAKTLTKKNRTEKSAGKKKNRQEKNYCQNSLTATTLYGRKHGWQKHQAAKESDGKKVR